MQAGQTDNSHDAVRGLRRRLRRLRRAGRALLTTRVVSWICVLAMAATAVLVLADLAMRFPGVLRGVLLLAMVVGAAVLVRRRLVPVARFKPALSDVAMRVERWIAARGKGNAGPIASGIGVPIDDEDELTRRLSRVVAAEAASGLRATPWGVLRWGRPARALLLAVACAGALSVATNMSPTLAVTGLTRLFMPWSDAAWPKRTEIADATPSSVHPADMALPLRATLLRTPAREGESVVRLRYRVIEGKDASPEREALLVPQPAASGTGGAGVLGGEVYERLIEPAAWRQAAGGGAGRGTEGERWLEYSFESGDDRTPPKRLRIVDPPVLVDVASEVAVPAYAAGFADRFSGELAVSSPAGAGTLIETGPVLAGSGVTVTLTYSKAVTPGVIADRSTVGDAALDLGDVADGEIAGDTVRVTLPAEAGGRLVVNAADGYGLEVREPAVIRLDVVEDAPPEATVLTPAVDEAVLETAVVGLVGEGRDDIALESVDLTYRFARSDPGSLGSEPVASGGEAVLIASSGGGLEATKRVGASLDLASIGAGPGDEVWVRAVARDTFSLDGATHEPVLSSVRRIRVIAPSEFIELIQGELEGVRRTAMRLDAQQGDVARRTEQARSEDEQDRSAAFEEQARAQAGMSQRLRAQAGLLRELGERIERNGLDDAAIESLLERAEETTERAAEASEQAAEAIAERADGREAAPAEPQERVREELARLIEQLDQGQDDWVVRRNLEELVREQTELKEQTERIGERTVGRDISELSPEEQTELERIARRQEDLARRAQESIDELGDRADEIRENDPTQAAALEQAARDAVRDRLTEMLEQAAGEVGQNQTGAAGESQEQSLEAMQRMLEQLENAQQNRDEALRRQLASLIESIESLVRQQEEAIGAIDEDAERAEALARRVRTNTLATEASAREGLSELGRVADLLIRAAGSQAESVAALREIPADTAAALEAETEALARLNEALAEANRQDDDAARRQQEQERRELRDAYRAALEEQVAIGAETAAFAGEDRLDRRERAELRRVGQRQEALRVEIEGIPGAHGVAEIGVLSLMHDRLDAALADAVRSLGRGRVDEPALKGQARGARLLGTILETLSEQPPQPEDEFGEGGGGGGSGGGGQQGDQPPIQDLEQLRLLRGLQEIALESARGGDPAEGVAELQGRIAEQARALIEKMQQSGGGGRPPAPEPEPVPQPGETPAESGGEGAGGSGDENGGGL